MPRKPKTENKEVRVVKEAAKAPVKTRTPAHKPRVRKAVTPVAVFDSREHQAHIERQAYFYYLERGATHGHSSEDWLRAEMEVRNRWEAQQRG